MLSQAAAAPLGPQPQQGVCLWSAYRMEPVTSSSGENTLSGGPAGTWDVVRPLLAPG